jgi:hypothetical protein
MNDFLSRLEDEQIQLEEKLRKLESFLYTEPFDKISKNQQSLLMIQASAMRTYLICLNERISDLTSTTI